MVLLKHDPGVVLNEFAGYANPFCVLGLSSDAEGQTIQQAAQRALMERRLGEQSDRAALEARAIEQAQECLRDPIVRFRASLHWVVLNAEEMNAWGSIPTTRALGFDSTLFAQDSYQLVATTDSVVARNHNIGVLLCADAHRLASIGDLETAAEAWSSGFKRWSLCLASEEFLSRQLQHAARLDDPRLTRQFVRQEIEQLPRRLLAEPARLAAQALERRQVDRALALVKMIREAPFEASFVDEVLEIVYRPLAHRVETETESLENERRQIVQAAEEEEDASGVAESLRSLLRAFNDRVTPDLEQMLKLGDLPGLAEEHARDHASRFLERLGMSAWNVGDGAALAEEATSVASRYADARSLKDKLANSLKELADQEILSKELEGIMELAGTARAPEAIERLRRLKQRVGSADSKKFVDGLIDRISDHIAVEKFQEAMALMERQRPPSAILQKLEEARQYAKDPEAIAALNKYIVQVALIKERLALQNKTGCLIPILIGVGTVGVLAARGILV